jgi:hypothetical protein
MASLSRTDGRRDRSIAVVSHSVRGVFVVHAGHVVAGRSRVTHVSPVYGKVSLRWILVHMLEETARHAGHLDLMREQLDGATGD